MQGDKKIVYGVNLQCFQTGGKSAVLQGLEILPRIVLNGLEIFDYCPQYSDFARVAAESNGGVLERPIKDMLDHLQLCMPSQVALDTVYLTQDDSAITKVITLDEHHYLIITIFKRGIHHAS